jgi:splicing factor U2AF 65 kDa subunit
VLSIYVNHERHFGFVEFKTMELTTAMLCLDGVLFKGAAMKIRRPNDFKPALIQMIHGQCPAVDVTKLGPTSGLISHVAVVAQPTGTQLPSLMGTEAAAAETAGAGEAAALVAPLEGPARPLAAPVAAAAAPSGVAGEPSCVIVLMNMIAASDVADDEEYEDIVVDVRETCESFGGKVADLVILRTVEGGDAEANRAVGKIFVKFENVDDATTAGAALCKKCFNGNQIAASFFSETAFDARALA